MLHRRFPVEVEMGLAALVLLAWQVGRLPLEGSVDTSLEHARSVLRFEESLSLNVEEGLVELAQSRPALDAILQWAYSEIHTPVLFAFLAAACVLAPDRYPFLRTTFALSFLPALVVIGLYPLAPPHWLTEIGLGPAPLEQELTAGGELFRNSTAAAASQHFGFAVFVAAGSLWLFPRSPIAWAALAYPAIVFVVIVGTGNHYVVDCAVGTLTFVVGAVAAARIHRDAARPGVPVPPAGAALALVLGFALIAWGVESFEALALGTWSALFPDALALVLGIALVVSTRHAASPVSAESG